MEAITKENRIISCPLLVSLICSSLQFASLPLYPSPREWRPDLSSLSLLLSYAFFMRERERDWNSSRSSKAKRKRKKEDGQNEHTSKTCYSIISFMNLLCFIETHHFASFSVLVLPFFLFSGSLFQVTIYSHQYNQK